MFGAIAQSWNLYMETALQTLYTALQIAHSIFTALLFLYCNIAQTGVGSRDTCVSKKNAHFSGRVEYILDHSIVYIDLEQSKH